MIFTGYSLLPKLKGKRSMAIPISRISSVNSINNGKKSFQQTLKNSIKELEQSEIISTAEKQIKQTLNNDAAEKLKNQIIQRIKPIKMPVNPAEAVAKYNHEQSFTTLEKLKERDILELSKDGQKLSNANKHNYLTKDALKEIGAFFKQESKEIRKDIKTTPKEEQKAIKQGIKDIQILVKKDMRERKTAMQILDDIKNGFQELKDRLKGKTKPTDPTKPPVDTHPTTPQNPVQQIINIINSPITVNNYTIVQKNINIFIINVNKFMKVKPSFKLPIEQLLKLNSMAHLLQTNYGCKMDSDIKLLDAMIKSQVGSRMTPDRYSRFINELR